MYLIINSQIKTVVTVLYQLSNYRPMNMFLLQFIVEI